MSWQYDIVVSCIRRRASSVEVKDDKGLIAK